MTAIARYTLGTYRLCSPEETLARVAPHLSACGITRSTAVTGLDSLGVPSYCAIRPDAWTFQVSNGKGLTDAAAEASAVMEALELHHAENPLPGRLQHTSRAELEAAGHSVIPPESLHGYRHGPFSRGYRCEWVRGENLAKGQVIHAPASAIYFHRRAAMHYTTTNGLASGNHLAEATLHALYELIERDAMTQLGVDGRLQIRARTRVVDPVTIDLPDLREILNQAEADGTRVILMWLPSAVPVHTFWAVLLSSASQVSTTTLNVGWGTHPDKHIAASRALTEAAQSRVGFIHGAREDLQEKPVLRTIDARNSVAYRFFEELPATTSWDALDFPGLTIVTDLEAALDQLVEALQRAGHPVLARFDLTHPGIDMPVVKMLVPSLRFNHKLF